jgi:hypothetical protein
MTAMPKTEIITRQDARDQQLKWAVRKAADVLQLLAGEPVGFVIIMEPAANNAGGSFQTLGNISKEKIIEMLLHSAEGLISGRARDVAQPRSN